MGKGSASRWRPSASRTCGANSPATLRKTATSPASGSTIQYHWPPPSAYAVSLRPQSSERVEGEDTSTTSNGAARSRSAPGAESATTMTSGPNSCCVCTRHPHSGCLLYTSDAADEEDSVDLGGRRI